MKKLIAFGASSSSKSINKQLATYAASLLDNWDVEILDLNNFRMPMFSEDEEVSYGKHYIAQSFFDKIQSCDGIIISFAEHNGSYSVAYKNLFDWCSRINPKVYQGKPMILLSTSPGPGGAINVLTTAINSMPYFDGVVIGSFSLPNFYENFDVNTNRILSEGYYSKLKLIIDKLNK